MKRDMNFQSGSVVHRPPIRHASGCSADQRVQKLIFLGGDCGTSDTKFILGNKVSKKRTGVKYSVRFFLLFLLLIYV